ncbi:MAG: metallophosphoesterase [Prevotellaceae bacterium]|nr:metallophosphoesterase [Prevotellaceae bacterium]
MDTTFDLKCAKRNMLIILLVIAASILLNITAKAQTPEQWKSLKGDINLFIANDLGRNGYYEQKPIAELMGKMGEEIGPEAVIAAGDVHHFEGVISTQDPLWMTNYELIYSHPELMISWFPVLGNHEYRGSTQAVLDYRNVSRRWEIGGRYYTKVYDDNGVSIRLVLIDTTPLINRYHHDSTYPDVDSQDIDAQLKWIDETLNAAKEDWVIVVGHHPMYAQTKKDEIEQKDMQSRLLPILQRYKDKVAMYVCGHIHNFQHIRRGNDGIDYVVNTSASLARKVSATEGTVFCSPSEGFSVVSATKQQLNLYMIDKTGNVIHQINKSKKL